MVIDFKERFMKLRRFLGVVLCIWIIGLVIFIASTMHSGVNVESAEVVVILTGGSDRLGEGFKLFRKSGAKWLLISGVGDGVVKSDFKRYFTKYQVNPDEVVLGKTAADTMGNAFETGMFMQMRGYKKMLVVTSRYHLPRSRAVFSLENPDIEANYYGVVSGGYTASSWSSTMLIVSEYNKTIAYLAFHYNKKFAEWVLVKLLRLRY